jgi:ABC-type antimicrobial peptide transport system permease subunit
MLRTTAKAGLSALGFLLFAGMSLAMLFLFTSSIQELINDLRSTRWPTTGGVITASSVESFQESGDTYYDPKVDYRYSVNQTEYTSQRIRFGGFAPALPYERGEAQRTAMRYRPRDVVRVYYNPRDPSVSVLEPGAGLFRIVIQLGIWILLLALFCSLAYATAGGFLSAVRHSRAA